MEVKEESLFGMSTFSFNTRKSADRVFGKFIIGSILGFIPSIYFENYKLAISLPFITLFSYYLRDLVWYQKEFITENGEKKKGINHEAAKKARNEDDKIDLK